MYQNHHILKGARSLSLNILSPKEIYLILISNTWDFTSWSVWLKNSVTFFLERRPPVWDISPMIAKLVTSDCFGNSVNKATIKISTLKNYLKIQLSIRVKFTCHQVKQLLTLPCDIFNMKFWMFFFLRKVIHFWNNNTALCSFCNTMDKTPLQIFKKSITA